MPKILSPEILDALREARCDGNEVRLAKDYDKDFYRQLDAVLKAIGGRWVGRQKVHVFPSEAAVLVNAVVTSGVKPDGNPNDFFPTPDSVLDLLFAPGELESALSQYQYWCDHPNGTPFRILEPSAGSGSIARRLRAMFPRAELTSVELDPVNVAALRAQGFTVQEADFLLWEPATGVSYNLIVANPPFQRNEYIKHLQRAFSFLRRGGLMRAVAPSGGIEMGSKICTDFRRFVCTHGDWTEPLKGAFAESGTNVSTILVTLKNDDESWRNREFQDFRSWHAFAAALHIDQDDGLLERASAPETSDDEFRAVIEAAADFCFRMNREPVEINEDMLADLAEHYGRRGMRPMEAAVTPIARPNVAAHVEQQEFVLV